MKKRFRVKELAEARGITQEDLWLRVRQLGSDASLATIQRIWQNNRAGDPRSSTMIALARALGVSVEDLYSNDDQSYNPEHTISPSLAAA